jgi:hypothetical protein
LTSRISIERKRTLVCAFRNGVLCIKTPLIAKRLTTGRHDKKLDLPQRHQRRGRAAVGFADAVGEWYSFAPIAVGWSKLDQVSTSA